jgi:hypothetical protein
MKPLIIIRFSKDTEADAMIDINEYINKHPAKDDYHFFIMTDPEWNGPVDFQYFNGDSYQYNVN